MIAGGSEEVREEREVEKKPKGQADMGGSAQDSGREIDVVGSAQDS